nr:ribonuclease H-like domain-containing protein [Tanacetum cinerariifolium]
MRMEQYLTHTDYALWEVIVNGDAPASIASVSGGAEAATPPKTTEQKIAKRNKLKAKSTLLLAIPDEHLLKFHGIKHAKTLWEAIKTRDKLLPQPMMMIKGHFARECKAPKSQGNRNGDNTRRVVPVENLVNALAVTDGMGYDWSYQAEEGPTNFALMAFSSSGSSSSDIELEESLKEKNDLKLKLEKFETSFKNLTNLINSQISPKDKTGLGYDNQLNERDLNNKSDVFTSASDNSVNECEEDNNQANDRYKADDSVFKSTISETVNSVHETETSASKTSKESMEKPRTVRSSAPIIEDWESDSDDGCEIRPSIEQNIPSHAKINFVKLDKNTRKSVIEQHTYKQAENLGKSQNSRSDKRN